MKIRFLNLIVHAKNSTEKIEFSDSVTYLYGPLGTGKSTVARLIDYCLGGDLESTPAVNEEFLSAELSLILGDYACVLERGTNDASSVRVTWEKGEEKESVNAPIKKPVETPLVDAEVYNLSDLLFYLTGVTPIKVRKKFRDPDSPVIRLGFRDVWRFSYLEQTHLDSSFFRLEDPYTGRKSQDAMRFFTGHHSERLSQLEVELFSAIDEQRGKREAVKQIRHFMERFQLGTELNLLDELEKTQDKLAEEKNKQKKLLQERQVSTHPADELRNVLRGLGAEIEDLRCAINDSEIEIGEQKAVRAELITARIKASRSEQAVSILQGAKYSRCPQCGADVSDRSDDGICSLCCKAATENATLSPTDLEAARRELNERIEQITDSIQRREQTLEQTRRRLEEIEARKAINDKRLDDELSRYDSAFIETIREVDTEIATLTERIRSLKQLQEMPQAIKELEQKAGALEGNIGECRAMIEKEKERLRDADEHLHAIADKFKTIMLSVGFPGVSEDDVILLEPTNWKPLVKYGEQQWGFWDAGSGGKKTLFNVCYALALHETALERDLPVPQVLVIDSPTKNISADENPDLVRSLYRVIYRLSALQQEHGVQFLLIDSDLVEPESELPGFTKRRLANDEDAPGLFSHYDGP